MALSKIVPLSMLISVAIPGMVRAEHPEPPRELEKVIVSAPEPLPHSSAHLDQSDIDAMKSSTSDTASLLKGHCMAQAVYPVCL